MEDRVDENDVLINNAPFGLIENLNEETIFNDEVFNWLFAINNLGKREKQKIKLQEKAKQLQLITPFKNVLKQYEKQYLKEINKNNNRKNNILKPTHDEVAKRLLENEHIVIYENDLYVYDNGVYSRDKRNIERKIIEIVPDATSHYRDEVYKNLILESNEITLDRESQIVNFKNGLLNLKDKKLYKHTPEFFSINQLNTNYNPNVEIVQAIENVLDKLSTNIPERKQTILEMIGYSMTTSVKLQKAFILYGNTAQNGKSTLLDMITAMLGTENVGSVPFKEMNQNKFAASGIKDKILNSGKEMTDEFVIDISNFKMFVTGDELEIEEKFKARQKIKPYAKFIFSANELPKVADKTNGFYRRLQIIPLEYSFTNKDRKVFDFNKLVSEKAREYLAKISIEAYLNIKDTFSNNEESEKEVDKYRTETNSILSFINDEEYITTFFTASTKTRYADEVYSSYKKYCEANQCRPIGRNKFYKEIEKSLLINVSSYNHKKTYTFNESFYKNT